MILTTVLSESIVVDINRPERTAGEVVVRKMRDVPGRLPGQEVDGCLVSRVVDPREIAGFGKIRPVKGLFKARVIGSNKIAIAWPALPWTERHDNSAARDLLDPLSKPGNKCVVKAFETSINEFAADNSRNENMKTLLLEFPENVSLHPEAMKAMEKCINKKDLKLELLPLDVETKRFEGDDANARFPKTVSVKQEDNQATNSVAVHVVLQSSWRVLFRVAAEQMGRKEGDLEDNEETAGEAALREAMGGDY